MSVILTFLGEFEIVTTGFAIVDFHVGYFFHYGAVSKQCHSISTYIKLNLMTKLFLYIYK